MIKASYVFSIAFIISFILMSTASALGSPKENPEQKGKALAHIEVVHGDTVTAFMIQKLPNQGGLVELAQSNGTRVVRPLSNDDLAFLIEKIAALKGPTNRIDFCQRKYIKVSTPRHTLIGCSGSKTMLSKQMLTLINLLNYVL